MRQLLFLTLSLVLLGSAAPLALASAEPYGRHVVLADARWPAEIGFWSAPAATADPQATRAAIQALEARAEEQELSGGPYAPGLPETLDDLARSYDALGDQQRALRTRERALHLLRVNDGLYSERQGPLLQTMLNNLWRAGDFAALDDRYRYFYRLYGAGRPPYDAIRWPAVMEYLRWQREAFRREIDDDQDRRLLDLHHESELLLETLIEEPGRGSSNMLRDAALAHLKTLYIIKDQYEAPDEFTRAFDEPFARNDPMDFDTQRDQLENIERRSRTAAKQLLEAVIVAMPEDELLARAEIELALADWLQWNGSTRDARLRYEALWRAMQRNGLADRAREWFALPTPLPDNGVFQQSDAAVDARVLVPVAVSAAGRPDVTTAGLPDEQGRYASRLRRHLRALRFRPAIEAGSVIDRDLGMQSFLLFSR
jgi:hypothetical protein